MQRYLTCALSFDTMCSRCQQEQQRRQLTVRAAQEGGEESKLPFLLDVNTRGGLLFVSTIGTGGVFGLYKLVVAAGVDGLQAGASVVRVCARRRLVGSRKSVCACG